VTSEGNGLFLFAFRRIDDHPFLSFLT
jgi:hypothetical protein